MATGRTLEKYTRVYVDGYDLSGFGRSIGPLELTHDEVDLTAHMSDTVKGYQRGHSHANVGTLNAVFDNTATTGIHAIMGTAGAARNVLVAKGILAAPADGDPCFGGSFIQKGYPVTNESGAVTLSIPFSGWAANAASLLYASPWGVLLHANAARTSASGANTGTGFDNPTAGATAKGGYFLYQVTAGNGTATLSVDDSADNSAWIALSGATSGSITCAAGVSGIVALATSATVRRYLRWQVAFGTATSISFACALMRAY